MAERTPPDKLSLIVSSGSFERVHYAFVMAAGAAAIGTPVTMFFTMAACQALTTGAGWRALKSEKPGCSASDRDADFAGRGVATMEELIESCAEMDVVFMVCEMGLRAEGLEDTPLLPGLDIRRTGVVTFLHDASSAGAMVYI